jgi:hypothetical protein
VPKQHARSEDPFAWGWVCQGTDDRFDRLPGDPTGTQEHWSVSGKTDDGGLEPYLAESAVEDLIDTISKRCLDVYRARRTDFAEAVRARGCDGKFSCAEECKGDGVSGNTHAYRR